MSEEEKQVVEADAENLSDTELSKEERLELARKKFEELKKKKKNKKSKKTKKEDETAGANDTEEAVSREETPVVDASEENKDEENKDEETNEEVKYESIKPEVEESKSTEPEVKEPKHETKEAVSDPQTEIEPKPKENETTEVIPEAQVISNAESGEEIKTLKETIEQQKNTIKKLRDENTDLKLLKMDLNDKIADLQEEIKALKSGSGSRSTIAPQVSTSQSSPIKPVAPAKPVYTHNDYATLSQQNFAKFNQTEDFREKLMVWKGWQVDMTSWNEIQTVAL
ncbi:uncharacterized protein RJT21DRAFT_119990 [Scheffersomyces amazonensis]|uniref:uncharacterized protein n=1 Tax=Scheffersomyces amazonensis TaxID=1078765 RepID=UPI00315DC0C8